MKICVVSLNIVPFFQPKSGAQYGGAEVHAAVLCDGFAGSGADVELVVADLGNASLPVPSHNAFSSADGIPGLRFFHPRLTGILSALERADADVYFQHCAGMITGLTAWFCKRRGKPFVYYAGSDTDFLFREARVGNVRDRMLYFWGLKNATGIVAQNERQEAVCRERLQRDASVIPMAIATGDARPPRKDGSLVWVGALREEWAYFLRCVAEGQPPEIVPPADSRAAVAACLAAEESAATGKVVELDNE